MTFRVSSPQGGARQGTQDPHHPPKTGYGQGVVWAGEWGHFITVFYFRPALGRGCLRKLGFRARCTMFKAWATSDTQFPQDVRVTSGDPDAGLY